MLTEIGPKTGEIPMRISLQVLFIAILLFTICSGIGSTNIFHLPKGDNRGWGIMLIIFIGNVISFLHLYFLPFWVIIDDQSKTLAIKYLLKKTKTIGLPDINGYSDVTIKSRSISYFGLVIYLSNHKRVLISDLTFDNYVPVQVFLDDLKTTKYEETDFSFLSYFLHQ